MRRRRPLFVTFFGSFLLIDRIPSSSPLSSSLSFFRLLVLLLSILVSGFDCNDDVAASSVNSVITNDQDLKPLNVNDLLGQILSKDQEHEKKRENEKIAVKSVQIEDKQIINNKSKLSSTMGRQDEKKTDEINSNNNNNNKHHAPHRHHNKPVIKSSFVSICDTTLNLKYIIV